MRLCFRCGGEVPGDQRILRDAECEHCAQDLHCCRNCRFHEPGASNQCAEPQAEWVVDKERANFCEFFVFGQGPEAPRGAPHSRQSGRDQWEKLFRKP
jgi:hypothetical protein